jgi:hypothetical protein
LKKPEIDIRGVTSPRGDSVLAISVGEPNQRRALLMFDAILKAVEARGWSVSITKTYPRQTLVEVNGETVAIRLTEKTKRSDRALTLEEQRKKRYEKGWRPPNPWVYAPTGQFTLQLFPERYRHPVAVSSDAKGRPLETQLNELMVAFVEESANRKTAREAARLRQIEEAKAADVRWKRAERERQAAEELKALEEEASRWERAERIRTYAGAVQSRLNVSGEEPSAELCTWLEWARQRADHLDPLCNISASEPGEQLTDDD